MAERSLLQGADEFILPVGLILSGSFRYQAIKVRMFRHAKQDGTAYVQRS